MHRSLAVLTVLTTSGIALWLSAPPASACSCVAPAPGTTDEEFVAQYDAVFTGTPYFEEDGTRWTFDVHDVEKGDVESPQDVITPADEAACGYPFQIGGTYRVFANENEEELHTNLCSPTEELSSGPGTPIEPLPPEVPAFPERPEPVPFEPPEATPIQPSPLAPPSGIPSEAILTSGDDDEGTSAVGWVLAVLVAAAAAGAAWFARRRFIPEG